MSIIVCGSVAYDNLMEFEGNFGDYILPDQIHILSVAFTVPNLRKEFGGCAGNIAYNLNLLGMNPIINATVGQDFDTYKKWLVENNISIESIKILKDKYTPQCFITTDANNNQLTSFHPGAMDEAHLNPIPHRDDIELAIIAPDGKLGTIQHAEELSERGIPLIFDPGQGIGLFNKEEISKLVSLSDYVVLNEYESTLLAEIMGQGIDDIATTLKAAIVTKGSKGSDIFVDGDCIHIEPISVENEADPTGCGDAYRAGLIYGIVNGLSWEETGKLSSMIGAIKVSHNGTQNHTFTAQELLEKV
ncbi:MAG: carbohydrate kinase family protein [Gammaproteobacteria bacterium]|nr:carbohydrate kinase family protein [Gammaproteobacteria bacterium]